MKGLRGERLSSQFQQEISAVISTKLRNKHPELSAIISVTEADIAPDLKSAKIYISIYDTDNAKKEKSFSIIKENAAFIRRELSQVLHIRTVPQLQFILDGSMEYGAKIDKLLEELDIKPENDEK
jgi:ribosome-binding factor A